MMSRLKPILSVLLALAVCGASSQAAVCDLTCGLAKGAACHMAAASRDAAMQDMPHGYCASEAAMQAVPGPAKGASIGSLKKTVCEHTISLAVEGAAASKVRLAFALWPFSYVAAAEETAHPYTASHTRPPPLLASDNPLFVTLRI